MALLQYTRRYRNVILRMGRRANDKFDADAMERFFFVKCIKLFLREKFLRIYYGRVKEYLTLLTWYDKSVELQFMN